MRRLPLLLSVVLASTFAASAAGSAPVITDGSLGGRKGTHGKLSGPNTDIAAELGERKGRSLFHGFQRFNVEIGGSATFKAPLDAARVDNVISRVTGGERSSIDGTLRSEVPGADLYLINRGGVLFGPGGQLDQPASFHVSTADELRLKDGAVFSARDTGKSTRSTSPSRTSTTAAPRPRARRPLSALPTSRRGIGQGPMASASASTRPCSTSSTASRSARGPTR
jgi:filamentous hemagglutinin family protein